METTFLTQWHSLVAVALWTGAVLGVLAVVVAVLRPSKRRRLLLVAALSFLPIGVFGILSIGVVFLLAAAVCLVFALLSGAPPRDARAPADELS